MSATSTFTQKVHTVVKAIPKGSVLTYKQVAEKAGNPKAARAVANLMAKNFDVSIPCHRVIRSDGGLGGYNRGGEAKKRVILQSEGYEMVKK
jgi:O-6-methylguanine DNA methyltransferase